MESRLLLQHHRSTIIVDRSGDLSDVALNGSGSGSRSRGNNIEDCPNSKRSTEVPASMVSLPNDAIMEILSHVPARSIHRFKCVSKAWRDLIADPLLHKRLPQTLEGFFCSDIEILHGIDGPDTPWNYHCQVYKDFISLPGRSAPLVDPSFSYLMKQPWIKNDIKLLGCCNGLLLFANGQVSTTHGTLSYIVCNPATEQWVAVPSASSPSPHSQTEAPTYLIVDLAISPYFHLVHIWQSCFLGEIEVHTYSSETEVWSHRSSNRRQWQGGRWEQWVNVGAEIASMMSSAFVKGMLHFIVFNSHKKDYLIAAVDREGKTCRNIHFLDKCDHVLLIGQSQGLLHCVSEHVEQEGNFLHWAGLCVWVHVDYDTDEWVLKHRVSFLKLFGKTRCDGFDYSVLAIHPDRNMLFFLQHCKLISYDMDSKELHTSHTLRSNCGLFTPYIPYFLESLVSANKD